MHSGKLLNATYQKEWYNREKLGFPTPIRDWLHEEKYYKIVRNEFSQDYVKEFFKQDKLLKMLDDYYDGKNDSRKQIWNVYTFLTLVQGILHQ